MIDRTELRKNLAANIRRLRKQHGISQEELARLCGAEALTIGRVERQETTPSGELLYSIADALGVDTDTLRQVALQTA